VHLVVPHARLPLANTVVTPAADRRSVFAVPRGSTTYIGTTDTFHSAAEAWPPVTPADVDYLFDAMATRLAGPRLSAQDVVSVWSGVRPLVAQEGKGASDISRRDEVWVGPSGVVSIAGGKLTAYRQMAERVVDQIEDRLGRKASPCRTALAPLPGGGADPAAVERDLRAAGAEAGEARRLAGLYGSEAIAVGLGGPAAEAAHAVVCEGALRLEDWWVRRSAQAFFGERGGVDALAPAAAAMAPLLGWSPARTAAEIAACKAIRNRDMAQIATAGALQPA
jgi:glycerol-3-phosphate dehydrogenase